MKSEFIRPGVNNEHLVLRRVRLDNVGLNNLPYAIEDIDHCDGVNSTLFYAEGNTLVLEYDASKISLRSIEAILSNYRILLHSDWWTQFKTSHYQFVDNNIKANSDLKPCSVVIKPKQNEKKTISHRTQLKTSH